MLLDYIMHLIYYYY